MTKMQAKGNGPSDSDLIAQLLSVHSDAVGQPLVINGETVCGPPEPPAVTPER